MTPANRPSPTPVSEALYPPLEQTDLAEQTYQVPKDRILRRQLDPGSRISVDEIAQRLGVSRTPVTDALKRLAVEGLVDIVPRRGTFVSSLTARDVDELFDVRAVIELYAAKGVLQEGKTEEFLRRIEQPMSRMRQASGSGDYRDYPAFMGVAGPGRGFLHRGLEGLHGREVRPSTDGHLLRVPGGRGQSSAGSDQGRLKRTDRPLRRSPEAQSSCSPMSNVAAKPPAISTTSSVSCSPPF